MDKQAPRQTVPRLSAAERRQETLGAAAEVFAQHGYHGATTDRIAREAGISQAYVVRMFGTKEQLFLAVIGQSLDFILDEFRKALPGDESSRSERLGAAYIRLAEQRGVHLPLMHAFAMGSDPVIGAAARAGFVRLLKFLLEEAELAPDEADGFIARGMLVNTLMGLRMEMDPDPAGNQLAERVLKKPRPATHAR
ncbi:TetR/AcrR family transcriptional regulator [Arthrobacter sp. zg-Y750]|uniref:TetR/AcrR family transcriptional regulator n=1 Tax=Arthrobacter sp. zg-Y750 TaxID=2894189 RepID=UPI001E427BC2|nr:TetR/AcrR family transcriptional regulator [Arthrobacter sp. zg-Y750]MCC9178705.1 TetR/AcrR family transcriptional regulator [Arthrobacter sp. zg-Y750]